MSILSVKSSDHVVYHSLRFIDERCELMVKRQQAVDAEKHYRGHIVIAAQIGMRQAVSPRS